MGLGHVNARRVQDAIDEGTAIFIQNNVCRFSVSQYCLACSSLAEQTISGCSLLPLVSARVYSIVGSESPITVNALALKPCSLTRQRLPRTIKCLRRLHAAHAKQQQPPVLHSRPSGVRQFAARDPLLRVLLHGCLCDKHARAVYIECYSECPFGPRREAAILINTSSTLARQNTA